MPIPRKIKDMNTPQTSLKLNFFIICLKQVKEKRRTLFLKKHLLSSLLLKYY